MEEWSKLRVHGGMWGGGIICGIMIWLALGLAGGALTVNELPGALFGGFISGFIMDLLG